MQQNEDRGPPAVRPSDGAAIPQISAIAATVSGWSNSATESQVALANAANQFNHWTLDQMLGLANIALRQSMAVANRDQTFYRGLAENGLRWMDLTSSLAEHSSRQTSRAFNDWLRSTSDLAIANTVEALRSAPYENIQGLGRAAYQKLELNR